MNAVSSLGGIRKKSRAFCTIREYRVLLLLLTWHACSLGIVSICTLSDCKSRSVSVYKTWQLRMHCNLRPPVPHQPLPALITPPCQVWRCRNYPLPYYSVFAADTLLYIVTLTCDLDLWPLTFAAYRLWRDETLYQSWTQSSDPQRSYCDFSIWPYDLEHCVTCCARLWDNFHQVWPSTTYPCLNCSVFLLIRYVTEWHSVSADLDFYSTSGVLRLNSVQNLSEIE